MKTITAIVGSPRKNSKTRDVVEALFQKLDSYQDLVYKKKIILLSEHVVYACKGCLRCFNDCSICKQYKDDLQEIEKKILNSDLVIFAAPVYAHNIPGVMKNLIDRLSYGLHIMRFIGKYGITISVSTSNGNNFVDGYLAKMFLYFGVKLIDQLSVQEVKGLDEILVNGCAKKIVGFLEGQLKQTATEYEELVFQTMKKAMLDVQLRANTNETAYWSEHGFFKFDTFESLFSVESNKAGNNI